MNTTMDVYKNSKSTKMVSGESRNLGQANIIPKLTAQLASYERKLRISRDRISFNTSMQQDRSKINMQVMNPVASIDSRPFTPMSPYITMKNSKLIRAPPKSSMSSAFRTSVQTPLPRDVAE